MIEERLLASEVRFLKAQRLAKVGSWERQIDADSIYWSDENSRIAGLQKGSQPNFSSFLKCVHPKDREKILETDRKIRLTQGPLEWGAASSGPTAKCGLCIQLSKPLEMIKAHRFVLRGQLRTLPSR